MVERLLNKVVFVTGAARGQGRSHAVRFAAEGADVIGIDICADIPGTGYPLGTRSDLDETVRLVEKTGRRMIAGVADVRDPESMAAVLDHGVAELGRLDFVLANAGIMPNFGPNNNTLRAWNDTLDVMLSGVMHTLEVTYPRLIEQGEGGAIVITSSMAAAQPMMRTLGAKTLGTLGYGAAKTAALSLMRNYASVLAEYRIRVNAVLPTGVNTPMIHNEMIETYFGDSHPQDLLTLVNAIDVHSVEPEDISNTLLYLCSEEGRYVTGTAIRIDAGANLR